jgi:thymidylate synthase
MKAYLDIVRTVLEQGTLKPNRTGVDTLSYFGACFRHDLVDGFPLLSTKRMDDYRWNSLVHELLWFLSGENHIRNFREKSRIWDAWADGDGNLETAYGFYWRHFPVVADGRMIDFNQSPSDPPPQVGNFDQIRFVIDELKRNPSSRRCVVVAWEPGNAHKSKLPPCHYSFAFNVQAGRLCLHWTQRSCDVGLGLPFNIASYALLTHVMAREIGLEPGWVVGALIDTHIYVAEPGSEWEAWDHSAALREQLTREPYPLPRIEIAEKPMSELQFEDFRIVDYRCHPDLKMKIAV